MNKYTLEELAKHHESTGSAVSRYVCESDYDALVAQIQVFKAQLREKDSMLAEASDRVDANINEKYAAFEKLNASVVHNKELAAQVEVLRGALEPFASTGLPSCVSREDYSVMHERVKDWFGATQFKKAIEVYNQTPAACLAQVKAEAGRTGWLACWNWISSDTDLNIEQKTFEDFANEYAERVRQGVV